MSLTNEVRIGRRFQRSVRIDTDLHDPTALEGFICPKSSIEAVLTMARHVAETGHGAFTWTGPYGTGKSSLVVAISALLNGDENLRRKAAKVFGREVAATITRNLPPNSKGWKIIPVVGRRGTPAQVVGEAIEASGFFKKPPEEWTDTSVIEALNDIQIRSARTSGGLILFVDEMGKFLEGAANAGTDVYFFQQLAEASSRSGRRLIVIGVLHQAFEEYAHRLSQQMRDEWSKIQGRFLDLAINTRGDEQIELLSRAIESKHKLEKSGQLAKTVARLARPESAGDADQLAVLLENCWPLHPVVTCLLGPITRRRFGQNQRSLFGFLNSSEPHGFRDFLKRTTEGALFEPGQLWDYLRTNLESSILASPDGHRWALAIDVIERCELNGADAVEIEVLKAIAVIDLFKERSGLTASQDVLKACFPKLKDSQLLKTLDKLSQSAFIVFRKYLSSYGIFAGSDFDVDLAVREELTRVREIDFDSLMQVAGIQPMLAKRHYHKTGAMRWFDVKLAPMSSLNSVVHNFRGDGNTTGLYALAIPASGQTQVEATKVCREAARLNSDWDVVVGLSSRAWGIIDLVRELLALEQIRSRRPELAGDAVARKEVEARQSHLSSQLEVEVYRALDAATWFRKHHEPKAYRFSELNALASEMADRRFEQSPIIQSELLNRQRPSVSAVAAQNALIKRMAKNEGEPRLGIEGYPAEGGLFASVLEASHLYLETPSGLRFVVPSAESDPARLGPIWSVAGEFLQANSSRAIPASDIYDIWRKQPYGVKDGLLPSLMVAFILSQSEKVAVYREGIFRARFDDVDADQLAVDPTEYQLRWMNLTTASRKLLSGMADIVRALDTTNVLVNLEPIDVARGLVSIYEQLPAWTKRTSRLSANAIRIRELFKRATDPNRFIFDDIPEIAGGHADLSKDDSLKAVTNTVLEGLQELREAYPSMIQRVRETMFAELHVPNLSRQSMEELRDRAHNTKDIAGDFRLEAFIGRISNFDDTFTLTEKVGSLAASKPARDWVDLDVDRALLEIADLAQRFIRAETFTRVKGRAQKRDALAVVVGLHGRPTPILEEFAVGDSDRPAIREMVEKISSSLGDPGTQQRRVILAALAELSAKYMRASNEVIDDLGVAKQSQ